MAITLELSPQTQERLEQRLQSGEYDSADDLVRAALQALEEIASPLDEATLDAIDRAEDQIERGEVHDWKAIRDQLRSELIGD